MSIQHPAGLAEQYRGVLQTQAANSSGVVEWIWNNAQTTLALTWVGAPSANLSAGFQSAYQNAQTKVSNLALTGQGNATIGGHTWEYQTYSFQSNGVAGYLTVALSYYSSSGRLYGLLFQDTSPGTLVQLQKYGDTFSG